MNFKVLALKDVIHNNFGESTKYFYTNHKWYSIYIEQFYTLSLVSLNIKYQKNFVWRTSSHKSHLSRLLSAYGL